MEKLLFFGDSITDASRDKTVRTVPSALGCGYVIQIAGELLLEPKKYEIVNNGINGDRIVDLYARIKRDVWNLNPDVLTILVGVNDVSHELRNLNGVSLERFENIYRLLLKETKQKLPNTRIILMEPFVLHGSATDDVFDEMVAMVKEYAGAVKKIACEFGLDFVLLQDEFDKLSLEYDKGAILFDGVHPNVVGSKIIAKRWLECFKKQ